MIAFLTGSVPVGLLENALKFRRQFESKLLIDVRDGLPMIQHQFVITDDSIALPRRLRKALERIGVPLDRVNV